MNNFTHQYAESSSRGWRNEGNGFISDTLIVVSNIPLEETTHGFDNEMANDLYMAAVEYAKPRGLNITFMSYDHAHRT